MNATSPDKEFSGARNLEIMREARNYNAFVLSLVTDSAPRTGRLLDFGAGSGTITRGVAAHGTADRTIVCVEADPALRSELRGEGLQAAATLEEVEPESVDFVYSLNVLEHIEDDAAILRQLFAVLRPGGRMLLYVPAFMSLYSAMDAQVGHFRRYRRDQLARLCRQAGFEIESSSYVDSIGFLASLGLRFAGPRDGVLDPRMVKLYDRLVFPVSRLADRAAGWLFGKNIVLRARKPAGGKPAGSGREGRE